MTDHHNRAAKRANALRDNLRKRKALKKEQRNDQAKNGTEHDEHSNAKDGVQ